MTAINLEMMKQLIEEFTEKEAITREEINVVQQEIKDLERRIVKSQERLETAVQDRRKVMAMKDRYSGQANQLSIRSHSAARPGVKRTSSPGRKSLGNDDSSTAKQEAQSDRQSEFESQSAVQYQQAIEGTDNPERPAAEAPNRTDSNLDQIESQIEKDDKTVGNINDALRKLFR